MNFEDKNNDKNTLERPQEQTKSQLPPKIILRKPKSFHPKPTTKIE